MKLLRQTLWVLSVIIVALIPYNNEFLFSLFKPILFLVFFFSLIKPLPKENYAKK